MFVPWRIRRAWERVALWSQRFNAAPSQFVVNDRTPRATIVGVGDVAPFVRRSNATGKSLSPRLFTDVVPTLRAADLTTANLETVCCTPRKASSSIGSQLRAGLDGVTAVQRAGIDVVNVANNHCLDFGADALSESVASLEGARVRTTGLLDIEKRSCRPSLHHMSGMRIAVVGYADDFIVDETYPMAVQPALADETAIASDIQSLRKNADIVILHLHWGYEFQLYPMLRHRDTARRLAEAGADIILCHHAHVPMGIEIWQGKLIAHGLGNFYFPPGSQPGAHPLTTDAFMLRVTVDERGPIGAEVIPTWVHDDGEVRLSRGGRRSQMLGLLQNLGEGLKRDNFLLRIERERTVQEACRIAEWLGALAQQEDPKLPQVARYLRTPRQRFLVKALDSIPGGNPVGELLRESASLASESDRLQVFLRRIGGDGITKRVAALSEAVRPGAEMLARIP